MMHSLRPEHKDDSVSVEWSRSVYIGTIPYFPAYKTTFEAKKKCPQNGGRLVRRV